MVHEGKHPVSDARIAGAASRQRVELLEIWRHLQAGDIACDIGANKGRFIYWLSWWVGEGRVVAFEPQSELARDCPEHLSCHWSSKRNG